MQTLYDVLGVPVSASQADVQNAYRRLLLRFHPERCYHDNDSAIYNPTAELDAARLQVLEKAHEILSNPKKRRLYDAYLTHKLRSHAVLYQSSYPQQWYARAAVVGAAGPSDDVLGSMMTDFHTPSLAPPSAGSKLYLSTYTASSQPSPVAAEAQTKPETQHDQQQQQQQQQPAAPMTETLNTPMHAMPDMSAADMPVVYAAAISLQRQPDGTVSVRTYKSGPKQLKTGQNEASSMSANSTAAAPATSATAAGAEATSKTTEVLPRRVRVMEQQLAYKGMPAGGEGVADAFGNVMSSLTNSVLSLMSTVSEA